MIELRGVCKSFGQQRAVDSVDLDIAAGEFLTLLGPSGCGKTTLLRMISGLEQPDQGQIILQGQDVTDAPPYQRDVNQVFQSYALFPHLNVWDNIAFGLRMKKISAAEIAGRVEESVNVMALGGMERRKPHELSGGQRQRVALARAIVNRPKVLLLDEPLAALDAKLRQSMQIELKRLQRMLGITFVFVTHDQSEALIMSDRIAVMNAGRIEQLGAADEIYHRPATAFVASFVGQANLMDVTVASVAPARVKLATSEELLVNAPVQNGATRLQLLIRPEKVYLDRTRQPGDNIFPARVTEELFRGAVDQLLIQLDSGLTLTAVVANESAGQHAFHAGDQIYCQLHPQDLLLIRD